MKHCRLTRYVRHRFGLFFCPIYMETSTRKQTDWERIEVEYRAGVLSLREIAGRHGITEGAIRKRAKRDGWSRNLDAKVQAKADELVRKAEVRKEVREKQETTERETVEASAKAIADVRLSHRNDISRNKNLCLGLLEELESQTIDRELYEGLGDMLRHPDDKGFDKLNDLYRKVINTPSRIDSMKKLADALKTLIELERKAWGIDGADDKPKDNGDALLEALNKLTGDDSRLSLPGGGGRRR